MNLIQRSYCRIYQKAFRLALPLLPYRDPKLLNSLEEIIPVLRELNYKSVLLVTDPFLKESGSTEPLETLLRKAGIRCAVYSNTCANPTVHNVEETQALYNKEHCQCLIAFGGGSSMDCAKAAGARIAYPHKSLNQMKGLLKVVRPIPTLFAIPTTAGTGSEVTLTAVITDSEKKYKYTMNDFTLIPSYAVLDAKVTRTLPPSLTATTGMDALTHAVEAYIGRSTTHQTRTLALKSVRLIFDNIEAAYKDGNNLEARANMLQAANDAGIAFSKSYVGYIHAVAHSLGGQYNTPHGLANSVLMPIVLKEYGASAYKKLHRLGIAAGVSSPEDSHQLGAEKFIDAIRSLNRNMNIPERLPGIQPQDIPTMAKHAHKEANPLYPVPKLMTCSELEHIYHLVSEETAG
jgi:alcohol dehydrogenase class IV